MNQDISSSNFNEIVGLIQNSKQKDFVPVNTILIDLY
jgi:hypothetical protein